MELSKRTHKGSECSRDSRLKGTFKTITQANTNGLCYFCATYICSNDICSNDMCQSDVNEQIM
jgi:hypothetical protein